MWKILVVEDNKENRELLVEILRDVAQCDAVEGRPERPPTSPRFRTPLRVPPRSLPPERAGPDPSALA